MGPAGEPVEAVFREERGRLLALLAARFGDLDLAEEVTAEALLAAVETWPHAGVPREPLAWLATTAARCCLPPKPPPICSTRTVIWLAFTPSARATALWLPLGFCVEL